MKISALNRKLHRAFGGRVTAALADGCIVLRGELDRWDDVVRRPDGRNEIFHVPCRQ